MNYFCEPCGDTFALKTLEQIRQMRPVEVAQIDNVQFIEQAHGYTLFRTKVSMTLPVTLWGAAKGNGKNTCMICGETIEYTQDKEETK